MFIACKAPRAKFIFLLKFRLSESGLPSINIGLFLLLPNTIVASHQPSDAPEPLITSVLCGCCCSHRCRQIQTSGEGILALRNSRNTATLQHRTCSEHPPPTPTPPTLYSILGWKNGMRHALCDELMDRCLQASGRGGA